MDNINEVLLIHSRSLPTFANFHLQQVCAKQIFLIIFSHNGFFIKFPDVFKIYTALCIFLLLETSQRDCVGNAFVCVCVYFHRFWRRIRCNNVHFFALWESSNLFENNFSPLPFSLSRTETRVRERKTKANSIKNSLCTHRAMWCFWILCDNFFVLITRTPSSSPFLSLTPHSLSSCLHLSLSLSLSISLFLFLSLLLSPCLPVSLSFFRYLHTCNVC